MTHPVKPRSTYRQQQAAATRGLIAEAARRLFAVARYGATSIEATAPAAGGGAAAPPRRACATRGGFLCLGGERGWEGAGPGGGAGGVPADPNPARRLR